MRRGAVVSLLLALAVPSLADGPPSLGAAAQKEKEKREKEGGGKKPAPVYGDAELKKAKGNVQVLPGAGTAPGGSSAASSGGQEGTDEAAWRRRAQAARDRVSAAEKKIAELQAKIEGLRSDLSPTNVMDPQREQTRQAEIASTQSALEAARAELAAAQKAIADLEDEARRRSVPPGWLR